MTLRTAISVCLAAACNLAAQPNSGIGAPFTGFLVEASTHSIVPIMGLPGSATLGKAFDLPFQAVNLRVARTGNFGLAVADLGDTRQIALIRGLSTGSPSFQFLDFAIDKVDVIAIDPTGTVALLISNSGGVAQFVTGLPDQAVALSPLSIGMLAGQITSAAVEPGGAHALLAASNGTQGGIYEIAGRAADGARLLSTALSPLGVAYVNAGRDAVYADSLAGVLVKVTGVRDSEPQTTTLASPADGIQQIVALEVIGNLVAVASGASGQSTAGNILRFDLTAASAQLTTVTLPVNPTRLLGMLQPGVFAVNEIGQGPVYLYSLADSSVVFVPPSVQ